MQIFVVYVVNVLINSLVVLPFLSNQITLRQFRLVVVLSVTPS